jgi:hypothetical protein
MDWTECLKNRIAKETKLDINLIKSTREIAFIKIKASEALPKNLFIGKITLLYDALREYLECVALEKGYKIYNHECYSSFLKEVLNMPRESDLFDELRKTRNGINYYGRKISDEEAEQIINKLKFLVSKFRK